MIILSGICPRHHNAIMLELTDFDDSKILPNISIGDVQFAKIYYYD